MTDVRLRVVACKKYRNADQLARLRCSNSDARRYVPLSIKVGTECISSGSRSYASRPAKGRNVVSIVCKREKSGLVGTMQYSSA